MRGQIDGGIRGSASAGHGGEAEGGGIQGISGQIGARFNGEQVD
jgi:hypothetical protein